MKRKKNVFSILEKIEKNKIVKDLINIKNLYLKEEKHINQLNLLVNYQKEYLNKINVIITSEISLQFWMNYKNFIFMLDNVIKENLHLIENNKKIIQESMQNWVKSQIKLKTWINFNIINKQHILQIKNMNEEIISNHHVQIKALKKDNYFNVRNH